MRTWLGIITAATLSGSPAVAQDDDAPPAEVVIPQALGQPADDDVTRSEPIRVRDEAASKRVEAMARFMTGQVHERRREFAEALEQYEQAVGLDPQAYRLVASYVPLAYASGRTSEAEKQAIRAAAEIDRGHELARSLAAVMAAGGRPGSAVRFLEKLLVVPRVTGRPAVEFGVRRQLGAIEQARGSADDAAEQYQLVFEAIRKDGLLTDEEKRSVLGDPGEAYESFGEAFLAVEDAELAVQAFEKAAEERPAAPAVHAYNLATVFRKTGKSQEALDELNKYLAAQLQTKGVEAYQLLADLYADLDREDDLLPRLGALVEADKRNQALRFFYAEKLLAAGRLDEAKRQYEVALGGGRDLRGLLGLIEVARRQKDAAALFGHIVEAFPLIARDGDAGNVFQQRWERLTEDAEVFDAVVAEGRRRIEDESDPLDLLPTYVFAKLLVEADRVPDAVPFYMYAIRQRDVSRYSIAQEASEPLYERRMFAEAADLWALAVEDDSPRAEGTRMQAYLQLANAAALANRPEQAEKAIAGARSIRPDEPFVDYSAAFVEVGLKRYDRAAEQFEAFIERVEGEDDARLKSMLERAKFQLSNIYTQMGQLDRGADILLEILEDDPGNEQANNDLGYLWADAGINLDRAEKMIRRALRGNEDNAAYLDSLGWVLYRKGDLEGAKKYLKEATALPSGNDAVLHEHLGDVLRDLGETDAARDSYNAAVEANTATTPDEELDGRVRNKIEELSKPAE